MPTHVLLHMRHWLLEIDADMLGFDREAEFAVTADAKYVVMPEASCACPRARPLGCHPISSLCHGRGGPRQAATSVDWCLARPRL